MGIARARRRTCTWSTSGHGHRRVRAAVRRFDLPIIDGLVVARRAAGPAGDRPAARPAGRPAAGATLRAQAGLREAGLADRRERRARRGGDSRRRHGGGAAGRRAVRRARCSRTSSLQPTLRERVPDHRLRGSAVRRARVRRRRAAAGPRGRRADGRRARRGSSGRVAPARRRAATSGGRVARKERYLVGLDVGTSKVAAIVGEILDDGERSTSSASASPSRRASAAASS